MHNFRFVPHMLNREEQGQGLVEYALLLLLVAVVVIGILMLLGPRISLIFGTVACAIDQGSDLRSSSYTRDGGDLNVTVHVSRQTTVAISGDINGGGVCAGPTCTYNFAGAPASGQALITASNGGCRIQVGW